MHEWKHLRKSWLYSYGLFIAFSVRAQAPDLMSYQAVIRNTSNNLVVNKTVGVKISILKGGVNGAPVYVETHTVQTNVNGMISLYIGNGQVSQGVFSAIDWSSGLFFIKTETDPNGGSNYVISGTSQLLSVPYALYAKSAGNSLTGIIISWPMLRFCLRSQRPGVIMTLRMYPEKPAAEYKR